MTICKGCPYKRITYPTDKWRLVDVSPQCKYVNICQRTAELAIILNKAKERKQ